MNALVNANLGPIFIHGFALIILGGYRIRVARVILQPYTVVKFLFTSFKLLYFLNPSHGNFDLIFMARIKRQANLT